MDKELIYKYISNELTPHDLILLKKMFKKKSESDFYEILSSIWLAQDTSISNNQFADKIAENIDFLKNKLAI